MENDIEDERESGTLDSLKLEDAFGAKKNKFNLRSGD